MSKIKGEQCFEPSVPDTVAFHFVGRATKMNKVSVLANKIISFTYSYGCSLESSSKVILIESNVMEEYRKSEIALLQLRGAINEWQAHNFVSALTLAGAANEILVQLCRKNYLPFVQAFEPSIVMGLYTLSEKQLKKSIDRLNKTRNLIKHHGTSVDEVVKADFFAEAAHFINSSIANYEILFGKAPSGKEVEYFFSQVRGEKIGPEE